VDLTVPEYGLAIEADGPSHFSRTTGRLLGPTVLKRRHLRKAGWAVLSVPLPVWEELIGPDERLRYLKARPLPLNPLSITSHAPSTTTSIVVEYAAYLAGAGADDIFVVFSFTFSHRQSLRS
jgi:hypothetical protein